MSSPTSKIIANPRDEAAFLRVVNMPPRIGDATLHKIHELCRDEKLSLGQATAKLLKQGIDGAPQLALGESPEDRVRQFKEQKTEKGLRDFLRRSIASASASARRTAASARSWRTSSAPSTTTASSSAPASRPSRWFKRWNNVEVVVKAIGDYEEKAENPSLSNFLDESHLNTDQSRFGKEERRKSGVTLMTIHSAKGLEFPFVFLMGLEDGLMPHERSIKEHNIEEERRLFYVALTRGKRHVTMFEALGRVRNGKERISKSSRFLAEIPPECYTQHIKAVRQMVEAAVDPPSSRRKSALPAGPTCSGPLRRSCAPPAPSRMMWVEGGPDPLQAVPIMLDFVRKHRIEFITFATAITLSTILFVWIEPKARRWPVAAISPRSRHPPQDHQRAPRLGRLLQGRCPAASRAALHAGPPIRPAGHASGATITPMEPPDRLEGPTCAASIFGDATTGGSGCAMPPARARSSAMCS